MERDHEEDRGTEGQSELAMGKSKWKWINEMVKAMSGGCRQASRDRDHSEWGQGGKEAGSKDARTQGREHGMQEGWGREQDESRTRAGAQPGAREACEHGR
jgi:hypothetical protein